MPPIFEKNYSTLEHSNSGSLSATNKRKNLNLATFIQKQANSKRSKSIMKEKSKPNFDIYLDEQVKYITKPIPAGPGVAFINKRDVDDLQYNLT